MYLWHNDRYWSLAMAGIKPVLTGTVIGSVVLQFPGEKEFVITGNEAQAVIEYALRNNVSAIRVNGNGKSHEEPVQIKNGDKPRKRKIDPIKLEKMSKSQSVLMSNWWADHPERWSEKRKKASGIAVK